MKRLSLFFAGFVFVAASLSAQTFNSPTETNSFDFLSPANSFGLIAIESTNDITNTLSTVVVVKVSKEEAKRIEQRRLSIIQSNFNSALFEIVSGSSYDTRQIVAVSPQILMKSLSYVEAEHPTQVAQFLDYHFFHAMINAFQWIGISATLLFLCRFSRRKMKDIDRADDVIIGLVNIFSWLTILGCFGTILFGCVNEIQDMAKIKHAPRIYIVEYVSALTDATEGKKAE